MEDFGKQMREAAQKHGESMRDQARVFAQKRKEEYLGARVPKELKERVIARAETMGIPVSNLIRNILEEAFRGAEPIPARPHVADVQRGTPSQVHSQQSSPQLPTEYPSVIGWEQLTLNKEMVCTGCGATMRQASTVTLGLAMPGEAHVILCGQCKPA